MPPPLQFFLRLSLQPALATAILSLALLMLSFFSNSVKAQVFLAPTNTELSGTFPVSSVSTSGVMHTGYDVHAFNENSETCPVQVYVWDGSEGGIGWNINGNRRFTTFHSLNCDGIIDPDVIVGENEDGDVYVHMVAVLRHNGSNGFPVNDLYFRSFIFHGCDLLPLDDGCFPLDLTDPKFSSTGANGLNGVPINPNLTSLANNAFLGRHVSSPNIDANANGDLVIAWCETRYFKTEIEFKAPYSLVVGINPIPILYQTGNVLYLKGRLGDACLDSCGSHSTEEGPLPGAPIAQFDETSNPRFYYSDPDVCISEGLNPTEGAVITVAYLENSFAPFGGSYANKLTSVQFTYDGCFNVLTDPSLQLVGYKQASYTGMNLGKPRIAAPGFEKTSGDDDYDFTIVAGQPGGGCDGAGYFLDSKVTMVGRRGNAATSYLLSAVTLNDDMYGLTGQKFYNNHLSIDPVVSYVSSHQLGEFDVNKTTQGIVVEWAATDVDNGMGYDIVSKSYYDDGLPSDSKWQYSRLNYSALVSGQDVVPSVAARHGLINIGYFWHNAVAGDINVFYRLTADQTSGEDELTERGCDKSAHQEDCSFDFKTIDGMGHSFPNPAQPGETVSFKVKPNLVEDGSPDKVMSYSVKDLQGREMPDFKVYLKGDLLMQVNVPRGAKPGVYNVRINTRKSSTTTKIMVQ